MPQFKHNFLARQRGAFLILVALLFTTIIGLCGLALDLGLMYNAASELKAATDSAALAGALTLGQPSAISASVQNYLQLNPVQNSTATNPEVTLGTWSDKLQTFTANPATPTAIKVTATYSGTYFFAQIFNLKSYTLTRTSIASVLDERPLNIMVIADISANMSIASQLNGIGVDNITQTSATNNLTQIYNELNAKNLLSGPNYGTMTWNRNINKPTVKKAMTQLKLDGVTYPYSGFTWTDYVTYIINLSIVNNAYDESFGFMTLINFWQDKAYAYAQTPILQLLSEQPLKTVKNTLPYLAQKLDPNVDTLGLTVISNRGNLVTNLSNNYTQVSNQMNTYQAGEYGAPDGTISTAVNAAVNGFSGIPSSRNKKVILIIANGQTAWDKTPINTNYDLSALKAANIYVYRIIIGPDASSGLNTILITGTQGQFYAVKLASTDYSSVIDTFYNDLRIGPPRLVQ